MGVVKPFDEIGRSGRPIRTAEDREMAAAEASADARAALLHAHELERQLEALRGEVGRAWQTAHSLQDKAGRLQREASPGAVLKAEEARLMAELRELEFEGGAA